MGKKFFLFKNSTNKNTGGYVLTVSSIELDWIEHMFFGLLLVGYFSYTRAEHDPNEPNASRLFSKLTEHAIFYSIFSLVDGKFFVLCDFCCWNDFFVRSRMKIIRVRVYKNCFQYFSVIFIQYYCYYFISHSIQFNFPT